MGKLYVCATPIGNLEDITLRAIRVLKEADVVAAEDTRHTAILLDKYGISTPLTSYHKWNIASKTKHILNLIKQGKSVALVSDAGMPGISDPGSELIGEAIKEGVEVIPIPGPSAVLTALCVSGLSTDRFCFEGFLPSKRNERLKKLKQLALEERTLVFYEAPHRVVEALEDIGRVFGERNVVLARELTKKFEEVIRGKASNVVDHFKGQKPKGEFVVVVEGVHGKKVKASDSALFEMISDLKKLKISKKDIVKFLSKHSDLPKNQIYDMVLGV